MKKKIKKKIKDLAEELDKIQPSSDTKKAHVFIRGKIKGLEEALEIIEES